MPHPHMGAKTGLKLTSLELRPVSLLLGTQPPARSWTRARDTQGAEMKEMLPPRAESAFPTASRAHSPLAPPWAPDSCGLSA